MRNLVTGDKVDVDGTEGQVLIAEGTVAFVQVGERVCRFELQDGKWQRDYYQPADGKHGHDVLRLLND
jgi:hypothetical protein